MAAYGESRNFKYSTYGGCDIQATIGGKVVFNLQAISYAVTRNNNLRVLNPSQASVKPLWGNAALKSFRKSDERPQTYSFLSDLRHKKKLGGYNDLNGGELLMSLRNSRYWQQCQNNTEKAPIDKLV